MFKIFSKTQTASENSVASTERHRYLPSRSTSLSGILRSLAERVSAAERRCTEPTPRAAWCLPWGAGTGRGRGESPSVLGLDLEMRRSVELREAMVRTDFSRRCRLWSWGWNQVQRGAQTDTPPHRRQLGNRGVTGGPERQDTEHFYEKNRSF